MTIEQFAVAVWMRRLSPRQFRAEVARQLASAEGVEGLSYGISIEAALVMARMGLGPGCARSRARVMLWSTPR